MKIKIINSLGTFISDELSESTPEELYIFINKASSGQTGNLRMPIDGNHTFFGEELIKNSIITIIK